MRVLLVRHGETAWNAERRLQGDTDVPLSDTGRAQAVALAPVVAAHRPAHVVASPLARTRATAELLGVTVDRFDPDWREAHLGEWGGRCVADLPPEDYAGWRAGTLTPPGAESLPALARRVVGALGALPRDGVVLVVTHGGPIRAALRHLVGLEPGRLVPVGPASLTAIDLDHRGARLRAYNLGAPPAVEPAE